MFVHEKISDFIEKMISKKLFLLLVVSLLSIAISAENYSTKDYIKVTLPLLQAKDQGVAQLAADVAKYISTQKSGMKWPTTKIVFYKGMDGEICFEIVAIDNSRDNLFEQDEEPYGYYVVNFRQFIVATKDLSISLDNYFTQTTEGRVFRSELNPFKMTSKYPKWVYAHQGEWVVLKESQNLDILARDME